MVRIFNDRKTAAVITLAIVLLDYAALDDITTGRESSFLLEYLFLMLSAVWFAALAVRITRKA
ncbi:MAG: hypothetical protein HY646_16840 [Acidobacteria bacterium]|nr:hypothetical protein [Acidobacteriota bacterium]